jgi:HSP20 family protein
VTARLPGVAPDEVEVEVEVDDREVAIRARVDATMDHGLLTVRLPRTERSKRRTIHIGRRGDTIEGSATEGEQPRSEGTQAVG